MALRTLLHSHGGSAIENMPVDINAELMHDETIEHHSTLDLRIASLFVILAGAVLFGVPTLLLKQFKSAESRLPRLLRAFAGGVVLALALVHIIPEAVGDLNSLIEYPIGGCTILFGIVILVVIDSSLSAYLAPEHHKQKVRDAQHTAHHAQAVRQHSGHLEHHSPVAEVRQKGITDKDDSFAKGTELVEVRSGPDSPMIGTSHDLEADSFIGEFPGRVNSPDPHTHKCLRGMNTGLLSSEMAPVSTVRQYVTAYTMELGCIFHSIIIGVGVGVITDDRQLVITLMVALTIHQGLEALALGSVLALTTFSHAKKLGMLLLYSITTPLGIAIGIAIASSYNEESVTSKAVQGTLNGVSGGMLLYIGMYQLVAEEFSREDLMVQPKLRLGMYAALSLGAALMCMLAVWA